MECTTFAPAPIAPVITAKVKHNPNPNHNPNFNPYPIPNQKPNHYPHTFFGHTFPFDFTTREKKLQMVKIARVLSTW